MCRGETPSNPVCESSVVVVEDGRLHTFPLCAHRQTRYHPVVTTRHNSARLYVTGRDQTRHDRQFDQLFDVRKYTHVVQITGISFAQRVSEFTSGIDLQHEFVIVNCVCRAYTCTCHVSRVSFFYGQYRPRRGKAQIPLGPSRHVATRHAV